MQPTALRGPVLIVDDDAEVLNAFRMMLLASGLEVRTASTPAEALAQCARESIPVCLVDLRLGTADGIRLCLDLREMDPARRTLIITAYPAYESAVSALKLGIADYLSKSESPSVIVEKVRQAIEAHAEGLRQQAQGAMDGTGIALYCNHSLTRGALDLVARKREGYGVSHHPDPSSIPTYPNPGTRLVMLCETCVSMERLLGPAETLRNLERAYPAARILLVNSDLLDEAQLALLEHGIRGFLPRSASLEILDQAIEAVLHGQYWITRTLTSRILSRMFQNRPRPEAVATPPSPRLSRREMEIFKAMSAGYSNQEIGERLFISESTVKAHIHHILRKLNVKSRTQAVLRALELRLL